VGDGIERIIEKIYKMSEDNNISEFLKQLVLAEAENISQWKEFYRNKVKEYIKIGGNNIEN